MKKCIRLNLRLISVGSTPEIHAPKNQNRVESLDLNPVLQFGRQTLKLIVPLNDEALKMPLELL